MLKRVAALSLLALSSCVRMHESYSYIAHEVNVRSSYINIVPYIAYIGSAQKHATENAVNR